MKKILVFFMVLALLFGLTFTSLFNVRHVYINDKINDNHSIAKMLREKNFIWTSAKSMSELIEEDKTYDTASVTKEFPFNIYIDLVEREPFIAIKSGGYYVIIDVYGVVLSLSDTPDAEFVIEGFQVTSAVLGEHLIAEEMRLIERAVQIVYMYKTHTDYVPKVFLKDDQIIQDMSDGIIVNYGQAEAVEKQFNYAINIYRDLLDKGTTSGIINISNPEQPFVEPIKN